jgi:hypothetical protein
VTVWLKHAHFFNILTSHIRIQRHNYILASLLHVQHNWSETMWDNMLAGQLSGLIKVHGLGRGGGRKVKGRRWRSFAFCFQISRLWPFNSNYFSSQIMSVIVVVVFN